MEITFHCDDVSFEWSNEQALVTWLSSICKSHNRNIAELSYIFCSDAKLLQINQEYLDHDFYTDVITFNLSENENIEGEIYISLDRIKANAQTESVQLENELCRVMAHGLLHLIGFDDTTPDLKIEMTKREDISLSLLLEVPRGAFIETKG